MEETEQASFDYEICDQDLFSSVAHFVVKEPSFFSDHSPVMTWLNVETNIRNKNVAHANDTLKRLPRQFCWEIIKSCVRPTRLPLFASTTSLPLEFGSHEYVLERFSSFVRDDGAKFVDSGSM